ncbi:hypothetical protein FSP39_004871 [Pinctada imbricata]|uniref:DUF3504 domain-containing protein n=1 Tax=Pinctada imbricata TaxID=66713 RepID=A0AA88XCP7_PINIB|nr:hypothetical protein FSP39_004871 [Pinctada imbricata]
MATPRFADLSEEDLQELLDSRSSANTKKLIKSSLAVLTTYLEERGRQISELEEGSIDQLNCVLRKFYAEVKKVDGERYAKKSMVTLRYDLQKHFLKVRNEDVINDERYATCTEMFKAVKRDGVGESKQKDPLPPEDISKLYDTVFTTENPQGLQKKTIFEYFYYFCNRGRENLRELQKEDFTVCVDSSGREYVTVRENHRGDDLHDDSSKQARMYDKPGDPMCPVASFKTYMKKLHQENPNFWQRPKRMFNPSDETWYDKMPVGKNTLYSFMSNLSDEANLSRRYTNHCIRATSITTLDHSGMEARHIKGVSGHKSENSIKTYSSKLSDQRKREMSDILCENLPRKIVKTETSTNCTTEVSLCTPYTGDPQQPHGPDLFEFDDNEVDEILSQIITHELNEVVSSTNTVTHSSVPQQRIPLSEMSALSSNFNFSNCQVTLNFR